MSEKPTESAINRFRKANQRLSGAKSDPNHPLNTALASALMELCIGLGDLSVGLRATYIKLEEIQRTLDKQATSRR